MSRLSKEIALTRASYWERERKEAQGKAVLLVEGDDDRAFMEAVFRRRRPAFPLQVLVVVAGSRKNVLGGAGQFSGSAVHLLVDRDTWTDTDVTVEQQRQGHTPLHVTPGWCLENIFLSPAFLPDFAPEIAVRLDHEREAWVRAGALWWTVQRTREAQLRWHESLGGTYGAPHAQLDVTSADRLAASLTLLLGDDGETADLNIESLAVNFEARVADILARPVVEQWQHVHGKRVFEQIVAPMLTASRGPRVQWRAVLADAVGRPPPLDLLVAQLLP